MKHILSDAKFMPRKNYFLFLDFNSLSLGIVSYKIFPAKFNVVWYVRLHI